MKKKIKWICKVCHIPCKLKTKKPNRDDLFEPDECPFDADCPDWELT